MGPQDASDNRHRVRVSIEHLYTSLPAARLHLARFRPQSAAPERGPALLLHGSVENGRVFYSPDGEKGLAPYLAHQGFDVFVADLRGRGDSSPPIGRDSPYGQTEAITEDLPALIQAVNASTGGLSQTWIAHSWGGVLLFSYLARFPHLAPSVHAVVCFGSKRVIAVRNWEVLWKIGVAWNVVAPLATRLWGYLPARTLGLGSDNETKTSHADCKKWVAGAAWIDPGDGFDYGKRIVDAKLPPTLYLAGQADHCLGHPRDVGAFSREVGADNSELWLLSKRQGFLHDYGHIDMLTHPDAPNDHFPKVVAWLDTQRPGIEPGPTSYPKES